MKSSYHKLCNATICVKCATKLTEKSNVEVKVSVVEVTKQRNNKTFNTNVKTLKKWIRQKLKYVFHVRLNKRALRCWRAHFVFRSQSLSFFFRSFNLSLRRWMSVVLCSCIPSERTSDWLCLGFYTFVT